MKKKLKKLKELVGKRVLVTIGMTGSRVDFMNIENFDDKPSKSAKRDSVAEEVNYIG